MSEPDLSNLNIDEFLRNPPSEQQLEEFLKGDQTEPKWHKFARGAYSTPTHWWMCHIHLSMLFGLWGEDYQRKAGATQSKFNYLLEEILLRFGTDFDVVWKALGIAKKYHRSYFLGRAAGGYYVNFALLNLFKKKFKWPVKVASGLSNFVMASYGTGIYLTASGVDSLEELVLGMITGETDKIKLRQSMMRSLSKDDALSTDDWDSKVRSMLENVEALNDVDPIIGDFCNKNATKEEFSEYCQRKGYGIQ